MDIKNSSNNALGIHDFIDTLKLHKISMERKKTLTCQVNLGLKCNQACGHCHLSAGPGKKELMTLDTMHQVIEFIKQIKVGVVDITGGAPEMNPHLPIFMDRAADLGKKLMLRCNLSALYDRDTTDIQERLIQHKVNVVASLPSLNMNQTDAQRGDGIFQKSMKALEMLNHMGYGSPGSGLVLDLVSNPVGAFMPSPQAATEKRFRRILADKWGIVFNHLFTFANMPLGRFETWLKKTDNYNSYMNMLYKGFNPCTLDGLMCRTLVSVSWDGYLYDCDFNLAAGLAKGNRPTHISQLDSFKFKDHKIAVGNHCYACTAGSGFT